MGAAITVVVIVFVVLVVLSSAMNSLHKTAQKAKGHGRCAFCKARLKAVNGQYAMTCRKCGHLQPWATKVA